MTSKKWDLMSKNFDTSSIKKLNEKNSDNIMIAWPIIEKNIKQYCEINSKILDFGSGTGSFVNMLSNQGYNAIGIDYSKEMVLLAKKLYGNKFELGSLNELSNLKENFDVITSIMVFQFIKDVDKYLIKFNKKLNNHGIVILSVFNPDFVESYSKQKFVFKKIIKEGNIKKTKFELTKGIIIDVFIRPKDEYIELFKRNGFIHLSTNYPSFTDEFVKKYKWPFPHDIPEFMIMTFQKN